MDLFEAYETLSAGRPLPAKGVKPGTLRYLMPLIIKVMGPRAAYDIYKTLPVPPQANATQAWMDLRFLRELIATPVLDLDSATHEEMQKLTAELLTRHFDASNLLTSKDDAWLAQRRRQYFPYADLVGDALRNGYASIFRTFRDLAVAQNPQAYADFLRQNRNILLSKAIMSNQDGAIWEFLTGELEKLWPGEMETIRSPHLVNSELFRLACAEGNRDGVDDFLANGPWIHENGRYHSADLVSGINGALANGHRRIFEHIIDATASNHALFETLFTVENSSFMLALLRIDDSLDLKNLVYVLKAAHRQSPRLPFAFFDADDHVYFSLSALSKPADLALLLDELEKIDPKLLEHVLTADNFAMFRHTASKGHIDNLKFIENIIRIKLPKRHGEIYKTSSFNRMSPIRSAMVLAQNSKKYDMCNHLIAAASAHDKRLGETMLNEMSIDTMMGMSSLGKLLAEISEPAEEKSRWPAITNREAPHPLLDRLSPIGFNRALYDSMLPFLSFAVSRDYNLNGGDKTDGIVPAYKLACLFKNRGEVARYLEPRMDTYGFFTNQPVHDACLFELPVEGQWTMHHWRHLLMRYGMKIGRYMRLAPGIEKIVAKSGAPFPDNPKDVARMALKVAYKNAARKPTFAAMCLEAGIDENTFNDALLKIRKGLKRKDFLPDIFISGKNIGAPKLYLRKLRPGDLRGFFLGTMTNCCMTLGDAGDNVVLHGMMSPYGGLYVVQKKQGRYARKKSDPIVAASWLWVSKEGVLVNDSIERLGPVYDDAVINLMNSFAKKALGHTFHGGEVTITEVHLGMGGQTPKNLPYEETVTKVTPFDHAGNRDSTRRYLMARQTPRS